MHRALAAVYWVAVAALVLPLALVVLAGLSDSTVVALPPGRLSLRWYGAALADPANARALLLSAWLAAVSATLAVLAGTWIALAARLLPPALGWMFLAAAAVPMVTPGLVHAIALRVAIQQLGLPPGAAATLLGHTIHATPLVAILVAARLATTPVALMEAAHDCGAGPVRAFLLVQRPWLTPTLKTAALLAGLTSFDDVIRSFFLGGYDTTLPVLIFARLRSALTPELDALATLALLAALLAGGVAAAVARAAAAPRPTENLRPIRSASR